MKITDIKLRLRSIRDTRQTTSAMELVSISKLKRAQESFNKNLDYFNALLQSMGDILTHFPNQKNQYFSRVGSRTNFIVMSSDKGLAGGYNHNVLNFALSKIQECEKYTVTTFGRTAADFFKRQGIEVKSHFLASDKNPTLEHARELAFDILESYDNFETDRVVAIFTDTDASGAQSPVDLMLLPLTSDQFTADDIPDYQGAILFDPSPDAVMEKLVPQYLIGLLYAVLLHTTVSEHKARMIAMESATRNADEILDKLKIEYNKARQQNITTELLEIVSLHDITKKK